MNNELAFSQEAPDYQGLLDTQIRPENITELSPFLAQAANIQEALNPEKAAVILARLSQGLARCGSLLAAAGFHANQAKSARQKAQAVAALDDFPKFLRSNPDVKSTDKTRDYFVDQHQDVLEAKQREDFYSALYEKLSINRNVLTMAISSARAIAFGHRDINMMSMSATPTE